MQGARGWRRWCCRAPGNEPHDSPLSNEEIRHLPEAVRLSCTPPFCRLPSGNSFDSSTLSTSSTSTFSTSGDPLLKIHRLTVPRVWSGLCLNRQCEQQQMLKISIFDTPNRRRFVLEGKLVAPWAAELRNECRKAAAELRGRELVIELRNVTCIGEDGENVLLELMKEGVRFRSSGVFTKHVMKRLARKSRRNAEERRDEDRQY
jgi:hypothetical protein